MPLTAGTRLGPYEILSAIGAGGMGEVYRARDSKLARDVALKVLPAEFALDPDRLARFTREAQVLASLNHPHIAAIYGFEDSPTDVVSGFSRTVHALVLEFVDGPTLADRIAQGPIPPDDALPIARQIAEALEAAHEQGIIHRDLKPANIKVRPDGTVKVLDFGLAKLIEGAEGPPKGGHYVQDGRSVRLKPDLTASPTITTPAMTMAGVILGTAAYMSPEQAKGKPADKRSDIWAFGCVLYEMLTGKRAFEGDDVSDTLAAVLRAEPEWGALPVNTAVPIRTLLLRCLQKDPKRRLSAIGVAQLDIDDALSAPQSTSPHIVQPVSGKRRERVAWTIATFALVTAVVLGLWMYARRPPADDRVVRFTLSLPDGWTMSSSPGPFRISPDGRRIVFTATDAAGRTVLWLRALDSLTSQELPGTDGAQIPFWSPDNRYVAFRANGKLKKIDVSGGQPITLCEAPDFRGGTWNGSGTIVFASGQGLKKVSEAGGVPVPVTTLPQSEGGPSLPSFLPDGRHFLYRTFSGIFVRSLDSPDRTQIFGDRGPGYVVYGSSRLFFVRDGTLMAQHFDPDRLATRDEPRPIADGIQTFAGGASGRIGLFSVSAAGVIVYQTGSSNPGSQLIWFDRSGQQLGSVDEAAEYDDLSLSPDGNRVAVSIPDPVQQTRNIWLIDVARNLRTQFTFDADDEIAPAWSRDGTRIAFSSRQSGRWGLYQKVSSGAGDSERLFEFPPDALAGNPNDWTADAHSLLFVSGTAGAAALSVLPLSGDRKPVALLTGASAGPGQLSHDDRWIAYFSGESGRAEVYVTTYPKPAGKWRVSIAGGTQPRWRRDGTEIFYISRDLRLMAAEVSTTGGTFQVGAVRPLFAFRPASTRFAYDVSPDGARFLVNTRVVERMPTSPLTVVVNWPAALER